MHLALAKTHTNRTIFTEVGRFQIRYIHKHVNNFYNWERIGYQWTCERILWQQNQQPVFLWKHSNLICNRTKDKHQENGTNWSPSKPIHSINSYMYTFRWILIVNLLVAELVQVWFGIPTGWHTHTHARTGKKTTNEYIMPPKNESLFNAWLTWVHFTAKWSVPHWNLQNFAEYHKWSLFIKVFIYTLQSQCDHKQIVEIIRSNPRQEKSQYKHMHMHIHSIALSKYIHCNNGLVVNQRFGKSKSKLTTQVLRHIKKTPTKQTNRTQRVTM